MSLMHIAIVIIVVGFLLWLVNRLIPMAEPIRKILNGVVIIVLVVWLLQAFGIIPTIVPIGLK